MSDETTPPVTTFAETHALWLVLEDRLEEAAGVLSTLSWQERAALRGTLETLWRLALEPQPAFGMERLTR